MTNLTVPANVAQFADENGLDAAIDMTHRLLDRVYSLLDTIDAPAYQAVLNTLNALESLKANR